MSRTYHLIATPNLIHIIVHKIITIISMNYTFIYYVYSLTATNSQQILNIWYYADVSHTIICLISVSVQSTRSLTLYIRVSWTFV